MTVGYGHLKGIFMYERLLDNLSKKIETRLGEISAEFNFDLGDEFEVALCQILTEFLPSRYAVCRGHIVDRKGFAPGDDIIVYDKLRFPSLRMLAKNDFSHKEQIPFEAVCCYIEAKHTLDLSDEPDASLNKALYQISNIQKLQRPDRPLSKITDIADLSGPLKVSPPKGFPSIANPFHTSIISRKSGYAKNKNIDQQRTFDLLRQRKWNTPFTPDLIVAGNETLVLPFYPLQNRRLLVPFCSSEAHVFAPIKVRYSALAVGLCQILWAIKWIQLDEMPWGDILLNSFDPVHLHPERKVDLKHKKETALQN